MIKLYFNLECRIYTCISTLWNLLKDLSTSSYTSGVFVLVDAWLCVVLQSWGTVETQMVNFVLRNCCYCGKSQNTEDRFGSHSFG